MKDGRAHRNGCDWMSPLPILPSSNTFIVSSLYQEISTTRLPLTSVFTAYGALPGGNVFFAEQARSAIRPSDLLPDDDAWLHILGYCNGRDLGCVSK